MTDSTDGIVVADAIRFVSVTTSGAGLMYVHPDHLGTPQKMTDESQTLVWDAVYEPFGEPYSITGTATNNQRFPGQYVDQESSFSYNYFRDYDPTTGRYVQSDPIGLRGGFNTYAYASANPNTRFDPKGTESMTNDDLINCVLNPWDCSKVNDCGKKATKATVDKFGYNGRNDESDAYRHCYLSCCMTQKIGASEAKKWGDGHENFPGNPLCEKFMDLLNNGIGRDLGNANQNGDCKLLCDDAPLTNSPDEACEGCG